MVVISFSLNVRNVRRAISFGYLLAVYGYRNAGFLLVVTFARRACSCESARAYRRMENESAYQRSERRPTARLANFSRNASASSCRNNTLYRAAWIPRSMNFRTQGCSQTISSRSWRKMNRSAIVPALLSANLFDYREGFFPYSLGNDLYAAAP